MLDSSGSTDYTTAMTVVTRFAPSPTGFLHIGGARTALFNYLFAKANGGKYLLRIEDTDRERSTPEATQAILDGLAWLGLPHDGEVVYQSERVARHQEVAQQLLDCGKAYYCYASPEELDVMREQARAEGRSVAYDRRWRDSEATPPEGVKPVVRLKAPLDKPVTVADAVQGEITIQPQQLDDFILLRSDGTPTYMLAVVIDDLDMGITHIIRGDDHLNNAIRQTLIYMAMGKQAPTFAHIPLIHGADGAKLSKRHGALGVDAYRDMGYLPQTLRNYLLRLGWSHGDDEIISDAQAIEWFNLSSIQKSPARFDFARLDDLNGHYLRALPDEEALELTLPLIEGKIERSLNEEEKKRFTFLLPQLKQRAKKLTELSESSLFLYTAPEAPEDEKAEKQLNDHIETLKTIFPLLEAATDWTTDGLKAIAKDYAETSGTKLGNIMAPIRVAITGSTAAPSMFEVMEALGRDESLNRLRRYL
jgi:glutamyl-tRNA synthetase